MDAIKAARYFSNTAYSDYNLDSQLRDDPDLDYTNAEKRRRLLADIYHDFFTAKTRPNPNASNAIKKIFEQLHNIDEFKAMQLTTRNDRVGSYIASVRFEDEIRMMLRKIEHEERKDFDFRDDLGKHIDGNAKQFRYAMRQAIQRTKEELDMANDLRCLGFGSEKGDGKIAESSATIREMVKRLISSPHYRMMIEMLGRKKRYAESQLRTSTAGLENLVGVTYGDSIEQALPEELIQLGDPDMEVLFLDALANGNIMQHDTTTKTPESKGDIIAILDDSGSMYVELGYGSGVSRMAHARSIIFGLATIATRERRRLRIIRFDTTATEVKYNTTEELFDWCLSTSGKAGGTDYNLMLRKTMEVMNEERRKKSDVIIITDGCSCVSPDVLTDFRKLKDDIGFKCVASLIGGSDNVLRSFADIVFDNLTERDFTTDSNVMKSIFSI